MHKHCIRNMECFTDIKSYILQTTPFCSKCKEWNFYHENMFPQKMDISRLISAMDFFCQRLSVHSKRCPPALPNLDLGRSYRSTSKSSEEWTTTIVWEDWAVVVQTIPNRFHTWTRKPTQFGLMHPIEKTTLFLESTNQIFECLKHPEVEPLAHPLDRAWPRPETWGPRA